MKISILTPSFNQAKYLTHNIESVMNQNYDNVEHIIVDGGSNDETVDILKKYEHLKWKSEKDKGQADALNKAFQMSDGDIIGWINSDDYYEQNIFEFVINYFQNNPDCEWFVGNLYYYYEENNMLIKKNSSIITYKKLLENMDIVSQQSTFFRRGILEKVGLWDENMHMLMDYDLWIRLSKIQSPNKVVEFLANFTIQPNQKTSSSKNTIIQLHELRKILKRENSFGINYIKIFIKKYWYLLKSEIKTNFTNLNPTIPISQIKSLNKK